MNLQHEVDSARSEIRTDGYAMSIGEWISLYKNSEIDIHPEFQRYYRWSDYQKSRLIESILIGIPIPQIFVSQRSDGVWDVVDGLQRLSTIYHLAGILRDENNELIEPLTLRATKYLPSLEGKRWDDPESQDSSLDSIQRLLIKRSKIDVSIILKESDKNSKYELFERLNTGGSPLSQQEGRNSMLVMENPELYRWMRGLSKNEHFIECTSLTDRAIEEQYDMELVLRFIVLRAMSEKQLKKIGDLGEFLTAQMMEIARGDLDRMEEEKAFNEVFSTLEKCLGGNSFHKFHTDKNRFTGGFLVSGFEVIALGLGYNYQNLNFSDINIRQIATDLWSNEQFISKSGTGVRASQRIPTTVALGRSIFGE